jgi:hypothetical protein
MKKDSLLHNLVILPNQEVSFYKDQLAHVMRTTSGYACGMCGKRFQTPQEAWSCVEKDTGKLTSFPIHQMNHHGNYLVHCLLCRKKYANEEDAALCLEHDLLKITDMSDTLRELLNRLAVNTLKGQRLSKRAQLQSKNTIAYKNHFQQLSPKGESPLMASPPEINSEQKQNNSGEPHEGHDGFEEGKAKRVHEDESLEADIFEVNTHLGDDKSSDIIRTPKIHND